MLTTDLSNVNSLQIVERTQLQAILAEQRLGRSGAVDPKTAVKIHTADFSAFTRYSKDVDQFDQKRYEQAMQSLRAASQKDEDFDLARVTLGKYEEVVSELRSRAAWFQNREGRLTARLKQAALTRRMLAISLKSFPKVPLLLNIPPVFHAKRLNKEIDRRVRYIKKDVPVTSLTSAKYAAERALMPPREAISLIKWALKTANRMPDVRQRKPRNEAERWMFRKRKGKVETKAELLSQLADQYLRVGEPKNAMGALARQAKLETDVRKVKTLAQQIEQLGATKKRLRKLRRQDIALEWAASGTKNNWAFFSAWDVLDDPKMTKNLRTLIWSIRELRKSGHPWFFSGLRSYIVRGNDRVVTGPRTDGLHSNSLRYFHESDRHRLEDMLAVVGETMRGPLTARFELSYRVPNDYQDRVSDGVRGEKLTSARPDTAFAFGMRDIEKRDDRPKGYGVRITTDAVQLGRTDTTGDQRDLMSVDVLAKAPRKKSRSAVSVEVQVSGRSVRAKIGKKSYRFKLPKGSNIGGYVGFHVGGVGFVEISNPKIGAR